MSLTCQEAYQRSAIPISLDVNGRQALRRSPQRVADSAPTDPIATRPAPPGRTRPASSDRPPATRVGSGGGIDLIEDIGIDRGPALRPGAIAFDVINAPRYHARMIRSFRDKETERIFLREPRTKFARPLQRAALRKLLMLHAAVSLNDLLVPPGNRLEKLSGDREGQYSIRVNDQWRVCFAWQDGDAHEIEIVDYH
jgi:toxin HigB-1